MRQREENSSKLGTGERGHLVSRNEPVAKIKVHDRTGCTHDLCTTCDLFGVRHEEGLPPSSSLEGSTVDKGGKSTRSSGVVDLRPIASGSPGREGQTGIPRVGPGGSRRGFGRRTILLEVAQGAIRDQSLRRVPGVVVGRFDSSTR